MSPTPTIQVTPALVQELQGKATEIYLRRHQLWQDYRILPEGERDRQSGIFRRVSEHLWDEYTKAWGEYLKAKETLDREIGLKENKARAEKVRSQTCMSCFELKATNGTCGC